MTDHEKQQELREQAETRLRATYNQGRSYLEPHRVMSAVRSAANGWGTLPGEEPPQVPADDLLAALTQVAEARAELDRMERDLIAGARERGASWQTVADYRGLASRQAAEALYLRLERGAARSWKGRDVPAQRLDRAKQRAADAWCRQHGEEIRTAAADLAAVVEAWPAVADLLATPCEGIAAGDDVPECLRELWRLLDAYNGSQPPVGERAAAASAARSAVLGLAEAAQGARDAVLTPRPPVVDTDPAGSADRWVSSKD